MKTLVIILFLKLYAHFLFAQEMVERFEYYGKLYEYQIGQGITTNKSKLTIKEADRLEINERVFLTTYNASIQILDKRNTENSYTVRIYYAEKVNAYAWRDFPNDYMEIHFNLENKEISYKINGTRLLNKQTENPEVEIIKNFGEFSPEIAEEIAIEFLLVHYGKLFSTGVPTQNPTSAIPNKSTFASAALTNLGDAELMDRFEYYGKLYEYTVGTGAANQKRKLTIKQADRLEIQDRNFNTVYFSSMLMKDWRANENKFIVQIFYAEPINAYSWRDFPNDYLQLSFDFNTSQITYESKGTRLDSKLSAEQDYEMPKNFSKEAFSAIFAEEIAIDYLIIFYGKLFAQP